MNPFLSAKSNDEKIKLSQVFGRFDEIGFEMEAPSVSSVAKGVSSVFEDIFSLVSEDIAGGKTEVPEQDPAKFPSTGTIEFTKKIQTDQKQKETAAAQRIFFQALKEDTQRANEAKNRLLFEEELNDIATNLPTEEKNRLLHYQASYKDRSIYQRAELRKKIIEEQKRSEKKEKEVSIAQTQTKATAMQTAFEGGSGTQGSGQSNLSFQATG